MKRVSVILFFLASLLPTATFGQDIHFSQFNGSLLNLSPGFTGLFDGDYRLGALFRSQWTSVPVSYSTFSMHGETRFKPNLYKRHLMGLGLVFNSDKAGDANYGSNQLYFNGNYIFMLKPDSSLFVTAGLNVGWCSVGFNYDKMTFDNQFNGLQYDRSLSSGETFSRTQKNYADVSAGSVVQYIHQRRHRFTYALGLHHVSRPVITYQGNDLSRLDFKITNMLGYRTDISAKTDIIMEALLTNQGKNYEIIPHVSLRYFMDRGVPQSIQGGLCWRARDAVVLRFGYNYKTLQSGIAYDVNISRFIAATNRRGAFELFVNYVFRKPPPFQAKKRACPVFM